MKAISYARVSTRNQEDNASLESQLAANRAYAAKHGFEIVREAREVFSGFYLFDRPLLNEIRREIKEGRYNALIVYDVDRLTRNMSHLGVLLTECERYNTTLVFVSGDFENSPDGKLLLSIKSYLAEAERVKITERTTRGRRAKAQAGTLSYKRKLFGYDLDEDGKRIVSEKDSATVKRMFAEFLNGNSLRQIAAALNAENVLTATGKFWFARSVQIVLNNPAYAGKTTAFREKKVSRYVEGERRSQRIYQTENTVELPGITPAIITAAEFDAAQKQLQINRKQKRGLATHEFLLRGLIRCGKCGRLFSPHHGNGSRRYVCTSSQLATTNCRTPSLNADRAENEVAKRINTLMKSEKKLKAYLDRRLNASAPAIDHTPKIKRLEKEIETIIGRMATANDRVWKAAQVEIEKREQMIDEMKNQPAAETQSFDVAAFMRKIEGIEFETSPFQDKVYLVKLFAVGVVFDGEKLQITYND